VTTMQSLAPTHGTRWAPAPLLLELAASGRGFGSLDVKRGPD
jgi:hypothetical protein